MGRHLLATTCSLKIWGYFTIVRLCSCNCSCTNMLKAIFVHCFRHCCPGITAAFHGGNMNSWARGFVEKYVTIDVLWRTPQNIAWCSGNLQATLKQFMFSFIIHFVKHSDSSLSGLQSLTVCCDVNLFPWRGLQSRHECSHLDSSCLRLGLLSYVMFPYSHDLSDIYWAHSQVV